MDPRLRKLNVVFYDILKGQKSVTQYNAGQFIEAVCSQPDVVACIDKITASSAGLATLQQAVRAKLSVDFYNNEINRLLKFLGAKELKNVNGGTYLVDIILKLVEPPIFWNSFREAFLKNSLSEQSQHSLGWLLYELCCVPGDASRRYRDDPDMPVILTTLLGSPSLEMRSIGQKLKHVLDAHASVSKIDSKLGSGPGGRHDNDYTDFRKISILPTADELKCTEPAFLRPSEVLEDPETEDTRVAVHLDNQFRLLREDMIYEMREELHVVLGKKTGGFHRKLNITGLTVKEIELGPDTKRTKWGLVLKCRNDLPALQKVGNDKKKRKDYLENYRNFLKHQSLACLVSRTEVIAFPTIVRDEDRLAMIPPEIVLQFEGREATEKALHQLRMSPASVILIQIDTAIFAYEPILKQLRSMNTLPLHSELLMWKQGIPVAQLPTESQAWEVIDALRAKPDVDLQSLLRTASSVVLDPSQAQSLLCGLTQQLSLLQGPPGTGKSFIGALLAKSILLHTSQTILVVCFTNHALDDILEGLLKIGVGANDMLRLGGKSTSVTEPLKLQNQPRNSTRMSRDQWTIINSLKVEAKDLESNILSSFNKYNNGRVHYKEFMEYLEFECPIFFSAFSAPDAEDDMIFVGANGQAIGKFYLIEQWQRGKNAGVFAHWVRQDPGIEAIWKMTKPQRQEMWLKWEESIIRDNIIQFCEVAHSYNSVQEKLLRAFSGSILPLLKTKRIVGCTTTAAAKYCEDIQAFNPNVLLVEEAGEILESHILTSLGPETSQVILIGDHKQLRPKVNNYTLTIEKGEGYDLNRSLFERLILKNYPHETLKQQHRMRPEISSLVRNLTYPELVDAPSTLNRPDIMGLQDNIVFINHEHLEDDLPGISERRDMASTSSKQNSFETAMILKIVKYLGQQGYGTDDLVILTPYLGQLQNLRQALKVDNDPILSDLDSHELVRAGLVNSAEAKLTKKPIRLATIDNYQGEECDIVIISLTRSNPRRDIGFLFSPERLNVLLSRSRNGLIIIGHMDTFLEARNPKGRELWTRLFQDLGHNKHIYTGLPTRCENHPDAAFIISQPEQFDLVCPDGGCNEPCGVLLSCGTHPCPSKCHQLSDHSKKRCEVKVSSSCPNGHSFLSSCSDGPPKNCRNCEREAKLAQDKLEREAKAKQKRDAEQQAHLEAMDAINARFEEVRRLREDERQAVDRANALKQKEKDLQAYMADLQAYMNTNSLASAASSTEPVAGSRSPAQDPNFVSSQSTEHLPEMDGRGSPENINSDGAYGTSDPPLNSTVNLNPPKPFPPLLISPSAQDWARQKSISGKSNTHVDALMGMIGLEEVKKQVLQTIVKIEATQRQNASLAKERFNIVFLGNPGTGKTTVARHYAAFLASMGVTPGSHFAETTGSSLANDGVSGAKKVVEEATNAGGGSIFIDETYQLTSGNSSQGPAVLDYLLAEMENQVGTLVFILAGYNKEMEKFFEHNPGLKSRVPHQIKFEDYKDEELMAILEGIIVKTFQGKMKVEGGGVHGLYGRIVLRRLARRRETPGFGNARDVQNIVDRIRGRQADRLNLIRSRGGHPDDFLFTAEDLIGPDPATAMKQSKAWHQLQGLIGLAAVKKSVESMLTSIQVNYQRELAEKAPVALTLNRVFLGSPGTGKTTVAKLYGQILVDLGMLSNGEVIVKNPSDFVGQHLGASEVNTKAILNNTVGKVLVIDEAYMLYMGGDSGGSSNQFKTAVIDTMVAEIQNVPGDDRCVLMLGYTEQMLDMFQHVNAGLQRRFNLEQAFKFEDFDDAELLAILDQKLKAQDLDATPDAKTVAICLLSRARSMPNFGNAGEVENLISKAKIRAIERQTAEPLSERPADIVFCPADFDADYNRAENAATNLEALFADIVGHDDVIERLRGFQTIAKTCRERGLDVRERIPTNFVFSGPPGTGKTTIARKIGQVFYDMNLLSSADVIECSASDLVGQYVGQTGPKVKNLFEKALGKVLFIDEAYRLSEGHFAQEAIDELVGLITQPRFKEKLVIILAGYEQDMNRLMQVNSGLSSRFPDQITFENMDADHCITVLKNELVKKGISVDGIDDKTSTFYREMKEVIRDLSELNDWGNARDMITFAKEMINLALKNDIGYIGGLELDNADILDALRKLFVDRQRRTKNTKSRRVNGLTLPIQSATAQPLPPPPVNVSIDTADAPPPPQQDGANTDDDEYTPASPPPMSSPPTPMSSPPTRSPASSRSATPNSFSGRGGRGGRGGPFSHGRGRAIGRIAPNAPRPPPPATGGSSSAPQDPPRDPGVSDAVWRALLAAKRAAEQNDAKIQAEIHHVDQKRWKETRTETAEFKKMKDLGKQAADERDAGRRAELLKQREAARLAAYKAKQAKEKAEAELREKKEAERKKKEQEAKAQKKLRELGVCSAGFRWILEGSIYRCAGGSHTVSVERLGL